MVEVDTISGIEMLISLVSAIIGCSILWSVSADSIGGLPDKRDGAHHAFNYIVAAVPVALVCNIIVTLQHSPYLRIIHFAALGLTGYLMTGIGAGDATMAIFGFNEDTGDRCAMGPDSNKCMPINPISFDSITLQRIKIHEDRNLSAGDDKCFSGAFFCWISLIFGMMAPVRYNIDQSAVIVKVIFWIGGMILAGIGIVVLSTTDVAVSPRGGRLVTTYRTSMQVIGLTLFLQLTSSVAFFSTDHSVARFTAAVAGYLGWFIPAAMFTTVYIAEAPPFNASDDDLADIRVGGLFCWFSSIAHVFACAAMLGGEDHGDRYLESNRRPTNTAVAKSP